MCIRDRVMKGFILIVCFMVSSLSYAQWYNGGNLHKATTKQWLNATYENKLATSADWAITAPVIKKYVQSSGSMSALQPYAIWLMSCVNAAAPSPQAPKKIVNIASLCLVSGGYFNKG